ncbi:MAG: YggS family pyridoxal phosphate-dependent enzyme [Verrucomicrobiota bacterium]
MSIAENLEQVRAEVSEAAQRSGRTADDVTLIAVSKTWPVEIIEEAVAAGHRVFGENKVQEVVEKVPAMRGDLDWHLIGHLQKNKTRKVLPFCGMIETLDSLALAQQVNRIAGELALRPRVLLQVNVSEDEAKFGFSESEIRESLDKIRACENLQVEGLMRIPAFREDPEEVRPDFAKLRELRDSLAAESGLALAHLSMGMSHDFPVAIGEGATYVRVGSSIFGQRNYSKK